MPDITSSAPTTADAAPIPNALLHRIPIVLGVVGHRDLREQDRVNLRIALSRVFDDFDKAYPNSPKILLSPLAPGADQLAAEVALYRDEKCEQPRKGWLVRAPLAWPPEIFLQGTAFKASSADGTISTDEEARRKFENLIENPRVDWFVVPLPSEIRVTGGVARKGDGVWIIEQDSGDKTISVDEASMATASREQNPAYADFRHACYANPGGYIVRHCHTLIAMWDGRDVKKLSGTAEIVKFQLGGRPPAHYPWSRMSPLGFDGDRGPVLWIRTPRKEDDEPPTGGKCDIIVPSPHDKMHFGEVVGAPHVARRVSQWERFVTRVLESLGLHDEKSRETTPHGDSPTPPGPWRPNPLRKHSPEYDQFLAMCQTIEDFNSDLCGLPPKDESYLSRLKKANNQADQFIGPDTGVGRTRKRPLKDWYQDIASVRETAGHLAGLLTPVHRRFVNLLFVLLFLALLSFHAYAHPFWHFDDDIPPTHIAELLAVFGAVWVALFSVVVWCWITRLDDRRHDYRALSEALRVRQAYALAGIGRSVADLYLSQVRTELAWIRRALLQVCPPPECWAAHFDSLPEEDRLNRLKETLRSWVQAQENQHDKHRREYRNYARLTRGGGFALAILGLVVLTVPAIIGYCCDDSRGDQKAEKKAQALPVGKFADKDGKDAPPQPGHEGECDTERSHSPSHRIIHGLHPAHPFNLILFLGTMFVVGGGIIVAVGERRAYEPLAKQYDRIFVVFRSGVREVNEALSLSPPDASRAQRVIEELGREALQENVEWLLLFRSKPLELPLGA